MRKVIQKSTDVLKGVLTLRGLPAGYLRELRKQARLQNRSLNAVLLEKLLPPSASLREGVASDLLSLAGTWDEKRAQDFELSIADHRRIDPDLWP